MSFTVTFGAKVLKDKLKYIVEHKIEPLKSDPVLRDQLHQELWNILQRYNRMPEDSGALKKNLQPVTSKKQPQRGDIRYGNSRITSKGIVFDAYSEYEHKRDHPKKGITAGQMSVYHYAEDAFIKSGMIADIEDLKNGEGPLFEDLKEKARQIVVERMEKNK